MSGTQKTHKTNNKQHSADTQQSKTNKDTFVSWYLLLVLVVVAVVFPCSLNMR